MSSALKSQEDGVAIAAPQIGYSLQIFIVSGKIFDARIPRARYLAGRRPDRRFRQSEAMASRESALIPRYGFH